MENDRSYFMKRAAQERSAASRSKGRARQAHEQMANRYRELAQSPLPSTSHPAEVAD